MNEQEKFLDNPEHTIGDEGHAKLQDGLSSMKVLLDQVMFNGDYTLGFLIEMCAQQVTQGYNIHSIVDVLRSLERCDLHPGAMEAASRFRHMPLKGLYKAHHFQASFLARNVLNETKRDNTIEKVFTPHFGCVVNEAMIGELAYEMVIGNFERRHREGRLTGEWIIFERCSDRNLYLTLESHTGDHMETSRRINQYKDDRAKLLSGIDPAGTVRRLTDTKLVTERLE